MNVRDKSRSLFENVVFGSLKSSFQLDHQVDIGLYLMEATTFHQDLGHYPVDTKLMCLLVP